MVQNEALPVALPVEFWSQDVFSIKVLNEALPVESWSQDVFSIKVLNEALPEKHGSQDILQVICDSLHLKDFCHASESTTHIFWPVMLVYVMVLSI